jgi:hypothetical protein
MNTRSFFVVLTTCLFSLTLTASAFAHCGSCAGDDDHKKADHPAHKKTKKRVIKKGVQSDKGTADIKIKKKMLKPSIKSITKKTAKIITKDEAKTKAITSVNKKKALKKEKVMLKKKAKKKSKITAVRSLVKKTGKSQAIEKIKKQVQNKLGKKKGKKKVNQ